MRFAIIQIDSRTFSDYLVFSLQFRIFVRMHSLKELIDKINNTPFSYMGEKIDIRAMDNMWTAGEDTIRIHFMYRNEKEDVVFKDMLVFERGFFEHRAEECLRQVFNKIDRMMNESTYGEIEEEI